MSLRKSINAGNDIEDEVLEKIDKSPKHKVRYIPYDIEDRGNSIIIEEEKKGYRPIRIGYSSGIGGHGLVILFEKVE